MSSNIKYFFDHKKEWSKIKDELFSCYFKPYFQKIIFARKPIVFIDCFAGKGKFDDGEDGSPLIANKIIYNAIKNSRADTIPNISTYFIDSNYADDLEKNLASFNDKRINKKIISGKYENKIGEILDTHKDANVFLYLDPYGIKSLNMSEICSFIKKYELKGMELLINFNSFGFYRCVCKVLKFNIEENNRHQDDDDFDLSSTTDKSEKDLDIIFGSNKWKNIVIENQRKGVNSFKTEIELSKEFCNNLNSGFKYVLNMPIRKKMEKNPKYRLVYATNHIDGCMLMADNMFKRSLKSRDIRIDGQTTLFEFDVNDENVDHSQIENDILSLLASGDEVEVKELICSYFLKFGVTTNSSNLKKILYSNNDKLLITTKIITTKNGRKFEKEFVRKK